MNIELIIGLGNPSEEYLNTYHNTGFLAIDYLTKKSEEKWDNFKDEFLYQKAKKLVFVKPLTFMNNSGRAVNFALKNFKAKPKEMLVIHDDSDITLGNFKFSFGKNAGGHKGVESVIKSLKTKDFWRLRIGIRPEKEKSRVKATDLILKKITPGNMKKLEEVFKKTSKNIMDI